MKRYKNHKKFYDFTRMTDAEIEAELASAREEFNAFYREINAQNVIDFRDYQNKK